MSLQHELHLFEQVGAEAVAAVAEDEMPVVFHLHDSGLKVAVAVAEGPEARTAVEIGHIEIDDLLVTVFFDHREVMLQLIDDLQENFLTVHLPSEDLIEGDGIGGVTMEGFLVDINADAEDAVADLSFADVGLDECTADLLVVVIDIIRPFDGNTVRVLGEDVTEGERRCHTDDELLTYRDADGMAEDGEEEVLPFLTLPGIRALSAAGTLKFCLHDGDVRSFEVGEVGVEVVVCGIGLVESFPFDRIFSH